MSGLQQRPVRNVYIHVMLRTYVE